MDISADNHKPVEEIIVVNERYQLSLPYQTLETSEGRIAYVDTGSEGFPVIFIHGNSCSTQVFKKQIEEFGRDYRLISIDLPGHGKSSKPKHPETAYTIPGYAKFLDEVVNHLGIKKFGVVGFSLGGNIALQWSQITDRIQGIMMISSAPMAYSPKAEEAYPPYEGGYATYGEPLSEAQARQYCSVVGFNVADPSVYFMVEDAMKTDGKAREIMSNSVLAGKGIDEKEIVKMLAIPLAVVVGNKDIAIGLDYIQRLPYRNLWQGRVVFLEANHAIPIHQTEQLHPALKSFLVSISKQDRL